MKPNLKAVPSSIRPLIMGPDIYAALKAKRESIDWAAVHIAADRRQPVEIGETRKGWMR